MSVRGTSGPVTLSVSSSREVWDVAIEQNVGSQWVMGSEWVEGMRFVSGAVLWDVSTIGRRRSRRWASDCHLQLPRQRHFAKAAMSGLGVGLWKGGLGGWQHPLRLFLGGGFRMTSL